MGESWTIHGVDGNDYQAMQKGEKESPSPAWSSVSFARSTCSLIRYVIR